MNIYFVYALIDPRDGSIFYIGKGKGDRPYRHLSEAKSGISCNPYKIRKINNILKAGYDCYEIKYLHKNLTEKEAFELEIKEIASHDNLTNISLGGDGGDNISNNPNHDLICKHISEGGKKRFEDPAECRKNAHYGESNGMYGKKHSKEVIEKLRKINSHSYEEKFGKEKADEIKLKFSLKRKEQYANGRKPAVCFKRHIETQEEIDKIKSFKSRKISFKKFSKEIGLSKKLIKRIAKDHNIDLS